MRVEAVQRLTEGKSKIIQPPVKEFPSSNNAGVPLRSQKISDQIQQTQQPQEHNRNDHYVKKDKETSENDVLRAAEFLNKFAKVFDFKLQFRVHKDTNRIFSKIVDPETEKVLREIPPEKMLDMAARMKEMKDNIEGILLDCYV